MVRAFTSEPVDTATVDRILDLARKAPSAGNTSGLEFLVLEGADTAAYWDVTLPEPRRSGFAWPALPAAPVLVMVWVDPWAYAARYCEPDKAHTGLGTGPDAWPVPYWFVDGGAAVMTILHACVDRGLGALFFGPFDHEAALRSRFGVPTGRRIVGTVAIGHRAPDRRSVSSRRRRPPLADAIHRGAWAGSNRPARTRHQGGDTVDRPVPRPEATPDAV